MNRTTFAEEPGTTVLAVGGNAGRAYEGPHGWEVWAQFHPAYEAGDYEAVIDGARETLEASGYALRLLQPRLLRGTDGPRGTTRSAACASPSRGCRASVTSQRRNTDLGSLRDEPAFRELIG